MPASRAGASRPHPPLEAPRRRRPHWAGHDRLGEVIKAPGEPVDAVRPTGEVPVDAVVLRGDDIDEAQQHVDGLIEPGVGLIESGVESRRAARSCRVAPAPPPPAPLEPAQNARRSGGRPFRSPRCPRAKYPSGDGRDQYLLAGSDRQHRCFAPTCRSRTLHARAIYRERAASSFLAPRSGRPC